MSTIDEIMEMIYRWEDAADDHLDGALFLTIKSAIDTKDAEIERLRARLAEINALYGVPAITLSTICALPLPEGSRQAEVLSDAEIQQARSAAVNNAPDDVLMGRVAGLGYAELHELSRAIEAAALEKNGMGVNRG